MLCFAKLLDAMLFVGSGHYGDATDLLNAMLRADVQNAVFYAIYDPAAVRKG